MSRAEFKPGNMLYPLPAVLVSCQRPGEKPNALTIAWAGTICSDPAMVSISIRPSRYSYDIIKETGSGWCYSINGSFPDTGMQAKNADDGSVIELVFCLFSDRGDLSHS